MTDTTSRFLVGEQTSIAKKEFLKYIKDVQKQSEISWLITDKRSFEWVEINQQKQKFEKELETTNFKTACVGVFNPKDKSTQYSSYKLS
ncbi:hypothetical protein QVH35_03805 [Candidatus Nitrosotenuis chungbukensis]|uniref:hypothetical protein n=1 Tax=Candidatus Nitrosotenuis chungbukensis TaxID=1353246 RepID=UPI0005B2A167|nr:hypothetical protein [Candidatus Nitrosotenuis chungbukensis]WKT58519.1 hypothetical protein QVH35_03805 [Candidatus Nitrosotenuis chungbukensis]